MKEPVENEMIKKQGKKKLAVTAAATVTAATALLLRVFYHGSYLRLLSSGIFFLCFAVSFVLSRPPRKIGFSAPALKPLFGAVLALTAAILLTLPLLLLGDSLGAALSYTSYSPFAPENAPSFLSLLFTNAFLPMLLSEITCRVFCISQLSDLTVKNSTAPLFPAVSASFLCGGLFALVQGEALRLPAFMLFGTAACFVSIKLSSFRVTMVFSILLGGLLQAYEGYTAVFGLAGSLPSISQSVGMLLIFSAAAIPAWIFGMQLVTGAPRPRGRALWLPLLIALLLLISGSAITGYGG